jgi:hypothetical protein
MIGGARFSLDCHEGSLADLKRDYVQWVLSQSATFEKGRRATCGSI